MYLSSLLQTIYNYKKTQIDRQTNTNRLTIVPFLPGGPGFPFSPGDPYSRGPKQKNVTFPHNSVPLTRNEDRQVFGRREVGGWVISL